MSVLKWQVSSTSNFALFFIIITHNFSVNFELVHFLLWRKGSHQSSDFDPFKCSGQNLQNSSCHFPNHKSVFFQILHHTSMSWKITLMYLFSSNNIYFPQEEPIKMKSLETFECPDQNLSNSLCQFWNDNLIPLQIWYPSPLSWKITPLYIFSSNNIYFAQKEHVKMKIFQTFKCSGQNSSMSILKWQVNNSSSNFASFFIVMTHNSSLSLKLILFLLWTKWSHKSPKFETFKCSVENLPDSLYHFPNHKSVFSSNFALLFSAMKDNSSVLFLFKH